MRSEYEGVAPARLGAERQKEAVWNTGIARVDNFLNNAERRRSATLQYRKRSICMLMFYVLLVAIPWILTCVLAKRPINARSYVLQKGYSNDEVESFRRWKIAVDVLNSIAGVITIPFLSALLAQAAVVFSQRQRSDQFLSLPDLLALSDRGWTHLSTVWRSLSSWKSQTASGAKWSGAFFLPAAGLILLAALQQPLYQILVTVDSIAVASCSDTVYQYLVKDAQHCKGQNSWTSDYKPIGIDIEPAQMALIYHNKFLPRLASDLISISLDEEQLNLWNDYTPAAAWQYSNSYSLDPASNMYRSLRPWLPSFALEKATTARFFAAALPANTTTGVLREHLMRLNSSVHCEEIDRADFPSTCPGENPFAVSLRRANDTNIRVCVPGKIGTFPWTLTRNRQDIAEELYLDLFDGDPTSSVNFKNITATIKCEAKTTRGYFELGNLRTNETYGSLLNRWPEPQHIETDYNDWVRTYDTRKLASFRPTEEDTYAGDFLPRPPNTRVPSTEWRTSGPLANSAMALFGNTSWLHSTIAYSANITYKDNDTDARLTWQRMCAGMPFAGLFVDYTGLFPSPSSSCRVADDAISEGFAPRPSELLRIVHEWIDGLSPQASTGPKRDLKNVETLLQVSLFAANRALLTFYSPQVDGQHDEGTRWRGRTIYSSPGQLVQRPVVSTAALIVLSILIGLQVLALAYLAYYIYHVPTWTGALDAMAMVRIGSSLSQQDMLPSLGPVTQQDIDALRNVDGLIGVHDVPGGSQTMRAPSEVSDTDASDIELRPTGYKGAYMHVEEDSAPLRLGLGAPGVIRSDSMRMELARRRKEEGGEA